MHNSSDPSLEPDESFARRMFGSDVPDVDVQAAYEATVLRSRRSVPWAALGAAAAAVAVVCSLAFTPLGGFAAQLLTIFEPQSFAPIAMTASDREQLRLAPKLSSLGTFKTAHTRATDVATLAAAAAAAGFTPRTLDYTPGGKAVRKQYVVLSEATTTFTFSAAKARAFAKAGKRNLPAMPAGLDGTTIGVTTGPGIVTAFGDVPKNLNSYAELRRVQNALIFAQMRAPHVTSTGASLNALENYLLSLPNVPANVATQLRAIADPQKTLPIPIQADRNNALPVDVDGVRGLAVGDETGLGSGVVWQKDGMLYALTGTVPLKELVAIANDVK